MKRSLYTGDALGIGPSVLRLEVRHRPLSLGPEVSLEHERPLDL